MIGMESMKTSVKGQNYEINKKTIHQQSELYDEPIGIYCEVDNQIDGKSLGFQIVVDKDDLINPSDLSMDIFGNGQGLNVLKDFTLGSHKVKSIYKSIKGNRSMTMDHFWKMSVRESLICCLNDLTKMSKLVSKLFDMMKEHKGNDVEGGFIIKMKMFNNNSQNFKVQFSDMKFKSDHMDWIDEVLLTMFPNQPMEVN